MIKNKEYYEEFDRKVDDERKTIDYCAKQAERFKLMYKITKDKKDFISKCLNRFAYRMNKKYYIKGMDIATKLYDECINNIEELEDYIKNSK